MLNQLLVVLRFPIILISLSGNLPDRTLQELAKILKDEIETVPSVLEAKIGGKLNEQVDIIIDPIALEGYDINIENLINVVNQNNMMVSAGDQDTGDGSFNISVPGLYETLDDVLDTPIKTFGDSVITFRDIAKVNRTFEDRKSYANVNGKNAVTIEVSKRVGENIIDTISKIKDVSNKVTTKFLRMFKRFICVLVSILSNPFRILSNLFRILSNPFESIQILTNLC